MEDKLSKAGSDTPKPQAIRKQPLKQSSGSDSSLLTNDVPRNKDEALVYQLNLLAEAFNEPLTANRIKVYVMALSDLSAPQLNHGLNRAVRELTFWPRPAELRELCTGIRARKSDTLRADEAWQWVMTYLDRHGLKGLTAYELQGKSDFFLSGDKFCCGDASDVYCWIHPKTYTNFVASAPFDILTTYPVPDIPPLIAATLTQLAGSILGGLRRLADARKIAEPWEEGGAYHFGENPKDISFLRKDFTEHYLNAVALQAEAVTQVTVDPSRQLTGEVPSLATANRLPIRLFIDGGLRYEVLPLDEAINAYEAGSLDENAFLCAKSYWEDAQPNRNDPALAAPEDEE
jgi:hypothetical protein